MTKSAGRLKAAIVGCGKIADGHVEEIQKLDNATVAAVCDREMLMAEQLAARYGIAAHYDDFGHMLREIRPDVVHITTPPQSHLALAKQAIEAGCHAYVEKPFTVDLREAKELIAFAESANRKVTVGHSFAYDPISVGMRRLIGKGVLGEPVHVECYLGYNLSGPFGLALLGDPGHWVHQLPGKLFQNNLDHILHKIMEFIPDENPYVHALGFVRRDGRFGDGRDDMPDELRVLIAGRKTTGYATFSSHAMPVRHFMRLYGTKNTLSLDYVARTIALDQAEKYPSAIGRLLPAFASSKEYFREGVRNVFRFARSDFQFFAGMQELFRRFYRSILEDTPPPIPYAEIIRIGAVMDEVISQVEKGGSRT